jgi:alpha-1,2-mannosyltransferase
MSMPLASDSGAMGRRRLWLAAVGVICGVWGAASLAIYAIYVMKHPIEDWMVYFAAARLAIEGNLPVLLDSERFTAHLNAFFAACLSEPFVFRSWAYPPPFLLLLVPFGVFGFVASCALFEIASFGGLLVAVWRNVRSRRHRLLHIFSLLLAPAVAFNVVAGQNGFLTGALMIGGFGALSSSPVVAGVLLGLLSYKPQFWLLVPVALAAARQWRVLAIAIATGAATALVSVAAFGFEPWLVWLEWALKPPAEEYQKFLDCCRLHDESVFTNLALLGAPKRLADLGQIVAALGAAGAVWWCSRREMPHGLRLSVVLAAAILAAPHVANYDAVLLVVASTLVFAHGLDHGFRPGGVLVPVLVWVIQLLNPPDAFPIGRITPMLTVLLIGCAMAAAAPAFRRSPAQWTAEP